MKNLFVMLWDVPWMKLTGYIICKCYNVEPAENFASFEEMTAGMCKTGSASRALRALKREMNAHQQW
eukprot:12900263-Prorocentrum_lima.AAC.1